MKAQREAAKPLTREDLKDLVVALGGLVRESVREEVEAAVKPLRQEIARLVVASKPETEARALALVGIPAPDAAS